MTKDGKIAYSDSPGPDAMQSKPVVAHNVDPKTLNLNRLSVQQADLAHECLEAVDNVVNRVPGQVLLELTDSMKAQLVDQFARFCPALGFKSPLAESTKEFNIRHSELVNDALERGGHAGPSFGRAYENGQRRPPLFSEF